MSLPIGERVSGEMNGQNIVLGSHAAEMPLDSVVETESECGNALWHIAIDG